MLMNKVTVQMWISETIKIKSKLAIALNNAVSQLNILLVEHIVMHVKEINNFQFLASK